MIALFCAQGHARGRVEGWASRFEMMLDAEAARPFQWGQADCATFAVAGIEALLGEWPGRPLPDYDDAQSAARALRALDAGRLERHADRMFPRIHISQAGLYDLALLKTAEHADLFGGALGFVNGATVLARSAHGIAGRPRGEAIAAWRIG